MMHITCLVTKQTNRLKAHVTCESKNLTPNYFLNYARRYRYNLKRTEIKRQIDFTVQSAIMKSGRITVNIIKDWTNLQQLILLETYLKSKIQRKSYSIRRKQEFLDYNVKNIYFFLVNHMPYTICHSNKHSQKNSYHCSFPEDPNVYSYSSLRLAQEYVSQASYVLRAKHYSHTQMMYHDNQQSLKSLHA